MWVKVIRLWTGFSSFFLCSHVEASNIKSKPFVGRKTWEQSTPLKKRLQQAESQLTYSGSDPGRDYTSSDMTNCQSHVSASTTPLPDAMKVATPYAKKQDLSTSGYVLMFIHLMHLVQKRSLAMTQYANTTHNGEDNDSWGHWFQTWRFFFFSTFSTLRNCFLFFFSSFFFIVYYNI